MREAHTHTHTCAHGLKGNGLGSDRTAQQPHAGASRSTRLVRGVSGERSWRWRGRTLSFIGLPRRVTALSASIGPLLLSHIAVYCSVTANAGVHYPHPLAAENIKTPERHMKERQQVHFIVPWSTSGLHCTHAPGAEQRGLDGCCCNRNRHGISISVRWGWWDGEMGVQEGITCVVM